jgi:hypothetical protein
VLLFTFRGCHKKNGLEPSPFLFILEPLNLAAYFSIAIAAIDRFVTARLKRNLGRFSAAATGGRIHLA